MTQTTIDAEQVRHLAGSAATDDYVVFKTENCTRCPLAIASVKRNTGTEPTTVLLDDGTPEAAELTDMLKLALDTSFLQVPIIMRPDGGVIRNLAELSDTFRK